MYNQVHNSRSPLIVNCMLYNLRQLIWDRSPVETCPDTYPQPSLLRYLVACTVECVIFATWDAVQKIFSRSKFS